MGNRDWDQYLRELLGDFKSEGETPHWEEFAQHLDSNIPSPDEPEALRDENLKEALSNFNPSGPVEGWDRIEASLDAEKEFDKEVHKKINQYEPPYDPLSWSLFLKQLSANKLLRAKLIALKVVESAAVLLLLLTVVNMGRLGRLPFNTAQFNDIQATNSSDHKTQNSDAFKSQKIYSLNTDVANKGIMPESADSPPANNPLKKSSLIPSPSIVPSEEITRGLTNLSGSAISQPRIYTFSLDLQPENSIPLAAESIISSPNTEMPFSSFATELLDHNTSSTDASVGSLNSTSLSSAAIIGSLAIQNPITTDIESLIISAPKFVPIAASKYLEFGILTQLDYNQLKMPEDRLYTGGKQIVFPLEGITSTGYGAGFTLAIGHPIWALETGIIYSSKVFEPDRELVVGVPANNGSIEFQAMRLQLVTVPLQYRYRFEHKGRLKAYAMAGFGLHVLAQSDIDVSVMYHFSSLSAGQNPNNSPALAQTILETRRISEHIRDKAPFSTKSFVSANLGLGLEYGIAPGKILFLQTAYQYQIPNLSFSNNSGKHILSISLQAGVRTPLGS